jgi:hypothetical protein
MTSLDRYVWAIERFCARPTLCRLVAILRAR